MFQRKYLAGFFIILAAIVYLMLTSFSSSLQYYVTVSELKAAEADYKGKTLKVAGLAAQIHEIHEENRTLYRFHVDEGGQSIPVKYTGFPPDTFKEGAQVVVTGYLKPDGSLEGTEILAKCASKYEAKLKNM